MTASRWRQITDLFSAALEREGDARRAYLSDVTAGDPDLRREIESLLTSHGRAGGFLNEPAWGVAANLILGEPHSLAGRRIGAYQVLDEIGRGGMGVVYAAEDERLGRTVALKALTPEYTRDPLRRQRLTREARAAASLSHPAIATIFALEEIDGELYMISEFVPGRTLRDELADGALSGARLSSTLLDIASALAAAHAQGIIHRDLKPENVMRRTDGQIKVLDFGLARSGGGHRAPTVTRLTEAGVALGTPGYMAPEQLSGTEVDARADLFAFGVLAWELATGEHPFGADPAALLARMTDLMEGRSAALSRTLPLPGLDRIARRCLRARPDERYQSSAELLDDLRAIGSGGAAPPLAAAADRLWWWRFHQASVGALNAVMPAAVWAARHALPRPLGSRVFLLCLALATISVTLRLNLWFTSRVHPEWIVDHRARLFPAVATADALLAITLLVESIAIAGTHEAMAALLLTISLISLASLILIEPSTTRAAFPAGVRSQESGDRR